MSRIIQVRVRDISFSELAAVHGLTADEMNPRYRDSWESSRGKFIAIQTPALGADQTCYAGGRVFLCVDFFFRSMCEHQLEIGD